MKRGLRIGVVGAGRVGQIAHLAHYAGMSGIELAIAEIRPELREMVATRYGVERRFADHHTLLAAGIDAAIVVTRRPATGPVVADCLAAGVHVLSEKPMALTVAAATTLAGAAERDELRYGVAYMKRCDAGVAAFVRRLRSRTADGRLGAPVAVQAWSKGGADGSQPQDFAMTPESRPDGLALWPARPDWLAPDDASGYEALLNVHSHIVNLVRAVAGPIRLVEAVRLPGARTSIRAFVAGATPLTFDFVDGIASGPWCEGIAFRFTDGVLRLDMPAPFAVAAAARVTEQRPDHAECVAVVPDGGAFARQARAFAAWLRDEETFPSPAADAALDVAFAEDVWRRCGRNPLARSGRQASSLN